MGSLEVLERLRREPHMRMRRIGGFTVFVEDTKKKVVRYRGITDGLKRTYWPEASWGHACRKKKPPKKDKEKKTEQKQKAKPIGAIASVTGADLGRLTDEQMNKAVTALRERKGVTMDTLIGPRNELNLNRRTLLILKKLHSYGWIPIKCQLIVSSRRSKRASAVDVLCWSPAEKLWALVEVKSGFEGNYTGGRHAMKEPFGEYTDSAYHQHQLQLMCTILLFCATYGVPRTSVTGVVMRVDDETVDTHCLADWVRDAKTVRELELRFIEEGGFDKRIQKKKRKGSTKDDPIVVADPKKRKAASLEPSAKKKKKSKANLKPTAGGH